MEVFRLEPHDAVEKNNQDFDFAAFSTLGVRSLAFFRRRASAWFSAQTMNGQTVRTVVYAPRRKLSLDNGSGSIDEAANFSCQRSE